jgi:predicted NBD/HSP70 family sugar kinase
MSAASHVIGVDIGGTKIAAGLVSFPEATVSFEKRIASEVNIQFSLVALASEIANQATVTISGIGIGICELVDPSGNVMSNNAVECSTAEIIAQLSPIAPVRFEADVRAAALAEALYGAGQPFRIFLFVTIGTGISACLMVDGKPFLGARGATGTIASSPLPSLTAEEFTLEQAASGPGLVKRYVAVGGSANSAELVLKAASARDSLAIQVVDQGARALAATLGMLIGTLDPEALIIGGGLGLSEGRYRDTLLRELPKHIWWHGHQNIPIIIASLGPSGPIIGAAAAALHRMS